MPVLATSTTAAALSLWSKPWRDSENWLTPPTFPALQQALQRAAAAQQPFDVVHFDGHGVYDRLHGLGGLCFEDPRDSQKLHEREMAFVDAREMASLVRQHRIPLVFLDACQSAQAEADPAASVAASLLE